MKTYITILLCTVAFTCLTLTAHAQAQRTFVSTSGNDANTASLCNTSSPCRSFTAAQTVTTAGGEIIALTSGGYGPVEITKSLQITAPTGVYVAITALPATAIGGTDAIRVNAAGSTVVVRGLTLNNVGTTNANGITFPAGDRLYVENCVINGFDNHGISVERSAAGSPELYVSDTIIRNGGNAGTDSGIFLRQTAGGGTRIRALINNCQLERAGNTGLFATDNTRVTVRNTVAARHNNGFLAAATLGTTAELSLENCTATLNLDSGIFVGDAFSFSGGVATARLSNTASLNNSVDGILIFPNGTAYISDSNINGNADDGVDVRTNALAHISTSTINNNVNDGIKLSNDASSRAYVAATTNSGNIGKGLNRQVGGTAVTIGSNRIFNNNLGTDVFSATVAQQ